MKLDIDLIEANLPVKRIGRSLIVFDKTASTNNIARFYAEDAGSDGLVIMAEQQSAGRGRLGRSWSGNYGQSLLFSILLRVEPAQQSLLNGQCLSMLAAVAVADAIKSHYKLDVKIKWPNDIMIEGRKLCGVMVEALSCDDALAYIIGVGLNCHQQENDFDEELGPIAISLRQLLGREIDRNDLARQLLLSFDRWAADILAGRHEDLHRAWLAYCDDINRRTTLIYNGQEYTGRIIDVCVQQGLIMQLDSGGVKVFEPTATSVKK